MAYPRERDLPEWALKAVEELPPLVSESEAATFFHVHPKTVARWRRGGLILSLLGSRRVLFPRVEVARRLADLAA